MKACWLISYFTCACTFTIYAKLPDRFDSFSTFWHFTKLCRGTITKPQTISWTSMNEFPWSIPRFKVFPWFWFRFYKIIHLFLCKKIESTINGLSPYTNFRYIAYRIATAFYKDIGSIHKIRIDIVNNLSQTIRYDLLRSPYDSFAKANDYAMYMCLCIGFTIPTESGISKINMDSIFKQRFP